MKLVPSAALALALSVVAAGLAFAAEPAKSSTTLTPQQQRMKDCNAQAGDKKGDERKAFMSTCLKGETAAPAKPMTQQEKMTYCNKQAGDKKGDERKNFMSQCLKADSSAPAAH